MSGNFPRDSKANVNAIAKSNGIKRKTVNDDLFGGSKRMKRIEVVSKNKKQKKNVKSISSTSASIADIGLGGSKAVDNNKNIKIDSISYNKYIPGCQAIGYIMSILENSILVSLPGGCTGSVSYSEISDTTYKLISEGEENLPPIKDLVSEMKFVRCVVVSIAEKANSNRKTIILSMRPSLFNKALAFKHLMIGFPIYGCVLSKEDHGYVISCGINGVNFFLPNKMTEKKKELNIGQPIECVCNSVNEGSRTVELRSNNKAVLKSITVGSKLTFLSLHPGMMVNVSIDKVAQNGLIVSFLGIFHGLIDISSLPNPAFLDDSSSKYSVKDSLVARIIFVDHANKSVRLSLRPHVLEMRVPSGLPTLGSCLDHLKVKVVFKKSGVLLYSENDATQGTSEGDGEGSTSNKFEFGVYIKQVGLAADPDPEGPRNAEAIEPEKINKVYTKGLIVNKVKAKGYHMVEGWILGSNIKSFVESSTTHISDIVVGKVVETEILEIKKDGLVIKVPSTSLRGFCPLLHTSDFVSEGKLSKRFKFGQKLSMRVWNIKENSIIFTNKKSLIELEKGYIDSLEAFIPGQLVTGVVIRIDESGIHVAYFNNLKSIIPMSVLVQQGVNNPQESFRLGQVIKCYVVERLKSEKNLKKGSKKDKKDKLVTCLALGTDSSKLVEKFKTQGTISSDSQNPSNSTALLSSTCSGTIILHKEGNFQVRLDDGNIGSLPVSHLFDFTNTAEKISLQDYINTRIENAVILSRSGNNLVLSAKPLLKSVENKKQAVEEELFETDIFIPERIEDLSPGQLIAGFVFKVENYGVLIKFKNNLTAIAPRPNISDRFISSPVGIFQLGDSVRCVVQRVDMTKQRVIVTFKPNVVPPSLGSLNFLSEYLKEMFESAKAESKNSDKILPNWKSFALGSIHKLKISSIEDFGVVFMGDDSSTLFLDASMTSEEKEALEPGKKMKVMILDIDLKNFVFEVTTNSKLTNKKSGKINQKKSTSLLTYSPETYPLGNDLKVKIEKIKDKYLVVSTPSKDIGYVMTADYHNPIPDHTDYHLNEMIDVKIISNCQSMVSLEREAHFPHDGQLIFCFQKDFHLQNEVIKKNKTRIGQGNEAAKADDSEKNPKNSLSPSEEKDRFLNNLKVGQLAKWKIQSISKDEVKFAPNVELPDDIEVSASVHISNAINPISSLDDSIETTKSKKVKSSYQTPIDHPSHPFHSLQVDQVVSCYVQQIKRESKVVDSGASEKEILTLYLSMAIAKSDIDDRILKMHEENSSKQHQYLPFTPMHQSHGRYELKINTIIPVVVTRIDEFGCHVAISPFISSYLSFMDCSVSEKVIKSLRANCFIGMRLLVVVKNIIKENNKIKSIRLSRILVEDLINDVNRLFDIRRSKDIVKEYLSTIPDLAEEKYEEGQTVVGIINFSNTRLPQPPAIMVNLRGARFGRLCITELSDKADWVDLNSFFKSQNRTSLTLPNGLKNGDFVKCLILSMNEKYIELSIRPSRLNEKKISKALKPETIPEDGALIKGYVASVSKKGCFIRISSDITGQVLMKDLADEFIENPITEFPIGKLVEARVTSSNSVDSLVRLSMKRSVILGDSLKKEEISKLNIDDVVSGTVTRITEKGVFIKINDTSLTGLALKAAATLDPTKSLNSQYEVGDVVRAKVLSIAKNSLKITLGLNKYYFKNKDSSITSKNLSQQMNSDSQDEDDEDDDIDEQNDEDSDDNEEEEEDGDDDDEEDSEAEDEESDNDQLEEVDEDESDDDDDNDGNIEASNSGSDDHSQDSKNASEKRKLDSNILLKSNKKSKPSADEILGELQWEESESSSKKIKNKAALVPESESESSGDDSDSDSDEEDNNGKKKSKLSSKQKDAAKRRIEQEIREKEDALASGTLVPRSKDDFERMLISQPNSSYLWIQYMAHYLQSADIENARTIASRALRTINFREEDEKYNVWVALLNLEQKYGTSESFQKVFNRAVSESKGKYIYLAMTETFEEAGDIEGAEKLFSNALKRPQYKKSKKVWLAYLQFKLRIGDVQAAKGQLARSMQSLSRHKHVELISKYGLAEFEIGSADRGRAIFEELLSNYPKRSDLWHLYVDKEIKLGYIDQARQLFERMISLKFSAKNMKAIFKKYLAFETKHGDEDTQELVRQKARDYVNSL